MTEAALSAGDRLQLRFARRGDRWEHAIDFRAAGQLVWQLRSDEGTADDAWPPSPPFQSLEMHTQPDGRKFALLVGMAGASHWSASVETDPAGERFVFDVACRIKFDPTWLGSSYVISDVVGKENFRCAIETTAFGETPDNSRLSIETVGPRTVVCITDLSGSLPRTVRWKYAISASEPAALARVSSTP